MQEQAAVDPDDPLLQRLENAEKALRMIRGLPQQLTLSLKRAVDGLRAASVAGASLHKVAPSYYDWSLSERARALCCSTLQLCKTVIFENKNHDGKATSKLESAKYLCAKAVAASADLC